MVTITHLVENIVEKKPFLEEALARGLINYAALAESIQSEIEKELKQKVKTSAIMMSLRRLSEKLGKGFIKQAEIKLKETWEKKKEAVTKEKFNLALNLQKQEKELQQLLTMSSIIL